MYNAFLKVRRMWRFSESAALYYDCYLYTRTSKINNIKKSRTFFAAAKLDLKQTEELRFSN